MVKTCQVCKGKIDESKRFVSFKEYDKKKVYAELHFHVACWVKNYNESLDKKVRSYSEKMMKTAVPVVKSFMESRGML